MLGCITEDVLPYALGIECVQAYSLVHDDLPCMDNDDMRRGKPSCHIAFGESTAVLAGDDRFSVVYPELADMAHALFAENSPLTVPKSTHLSTTQITISWRPSNAIWLSKV